MTVSPNTQLMTVTESPFLARLPKIRAPKSGGNEPVNLFQAFPPKIPKNPLSARYLYQPEGTSTSQDHTSVFGSPDKIQVSYDSSLVVGNNGRFNSISTRVDSGSIAPITSNRIDLQVLRGLDSNHILDGVLDLITDPTVFKNSLEENAEHLIDSDKSFSKGISKHMARHVPDLLKYGVITKLEHRKPVVVLPLFTVPKKDLLLRVVMDGRKLNRLTRLRPLMLLPPLHRVIESCLSATHVVLHDATSYFYQFQLHPEIRPYFSMFLGSARGSFETYCLSVMSMGWTLAPCIAQRSALVLIGDIPGTAWVDNFALFAGSEVEAASLNNRFLARCNQASVTLNSEPQYGNPSSDFIFLGIHFVLTPKAKFQMSPDWVEKSLSKQELISLFTVRATFRDFYVIVGIVVWFSYATRRKLCFYPHMLSCLSRIAKKIAGSNIKTPYEQLLDIKTTVLDDIRSALSDIRLNEWIYRQPKHGHTINIWTDASSHSWAMIIETATPFYAQGSFADVFREAHIFYKELLTAHQSIKIASILLESNTTLSLKCDNLPVVQAYLKGHSSTFKANVILQQSFRCLKSAQQTLDVEWVPTNAQRADPFTRGIAVPVTGIVPEAQWFHQNLSLDLSAFNN